MKKILCVLLAAVLMLSISVTAFASNINAGNNLNNNNNNSSIINPNGNPNNNNINNNTNNNNINNSTNTNNDPIPGGGIIGDVNDGGEGTAIPQPSFTKPYRRSNPIVIDLKGESEEENPTTGAVSFVPAIVVFAAAAGIIASKRK